MKWEKFAVIAIVCYLAIALPIYLFNQQAVEECNSTCIKEGYNVVINANVSGEKIECWCYDSFTRKEKNIVISQKG